MSQIIHLSLLGFMDVSRIQSASASSNQDVFFGAEAVWMHYCETFKIEGRSDVNGVGARRALSQVEDADLDKL